MTEIRLITFDLDNTLWDIEAVIMNAERGVFQWLEQHCPEVTALHTIESLFEARLNYRRQYPELQHQISQMRRASMASVLIECGYEAERAHSMSEQAFNVFMEFRHQVTFYDHALHVLEELNRHYRLGTLSNGNACLKRLGIDAHFDFHYSAEALNASKPAPDHFEAALTFAGCKPQQMIHVGDNPVDDIEGAQALGIHTIWMNHSGTPWDLDRPAPSAEINSLEQLPAAVAAIEQQLSTGNLLPVTRPR